MRFSKQLLISSFLVLSSVFTFGAWDIYKSGLSIGGAYYDCQLNTAAPEFQHSYFGSLSSGGTLTLNFAEVLTFKNGSSNVCSANLYYRVYRTGDTPPAFTALSLLFCCNQGGSDCSGGGCGPDVNNPGDQKWRGNSGVNLLSGLTLPGTYIIEVYYDATGDDSGGCSNTKFSSNSSNNYRAYFDLDMNDSFTDGNFTASPTWSGDTGNFQVVNNSTTSGLIGTEQTRTSTLKGNGPNASGSEYLSTPIATWNAQQEWYFWMGRDGGQAATTLNQIQVWVYSKDANLEGITTNNDGYRIVYGDNNGAGDEVVLQRVDDGVGTDIIVSSTNVANGLVDYGIAVKVTRSQNGVWNLYTSFLPQNSTQAQASPTPLSNVDAEATIAQGTATDNTYLINGSTPTGYVGPVFIHSSGVGEPQSPEFDAFRFKALPPNTEIQITGATSGAALENVANTGNLPITVTLTNPSNTLATTVDLVLTSGSATRVGRGPTVNTNYAGPYTTVTLTWAAGTSGSQTVYIDPTQNNICDDIATLVFTLQNPAGGLNAYVGASATYTATITDDDTGYETILTENFETGSIPATWVTTGTAWSASSGAPITGTYSARHSTQAVSGQSSITYPIDDASLAGVTTTWRFQLKYQNDPSANNNFQVFLVSTENNLFSSTNDGYALVVDQSSLPLSGTSDFIRLYRVDNNAYSTLIINSTTDWDSSVNGGAKVGIEVSLNDNGVWAIRVDTNGDFDNLVTLPGATSATSFMDNHPTNPGGLTYPVMKGFGARLKYTAGVSDFFRFDDVSLQQKGCKETWYSQSTGNVNGVIWSQSNIGTPQAVNGGRFKRFVIQGNTLGDLTPDVVTVNTDWVVNDLEISPGATLIGGSANTKLYGSWFNSGTFTQSTSNVTFKGQAAQSVIGATTFNDITIDNDGFAISLLATTSVRGRVLPNEGTLQTNGNLVLVSNSAGSGSIGPIQLAAGADVSGNVTLQRYIPSIPYIYGDWVNLGCPILGQTIQEWNDDIITTGFLGSDYPPPYPFKNIRSYNESTAGVMNNGYVDATNVTNALSSSQGYFVWLQGNAQNIDNTGIIQKGALSHSLSFTPTAGGILNDGWNLMTNPYPSEVDWNQVTSTFSVSNPRVYYVYDYQTKAYKNYNATNGLGTASRYIPHSQSFLVKVNTAGQNLVYQESFKSNNGTAFERSDVSENQFIALRLSRNGYSDESILNFNDNATSSYEGFDAFDLESPSEDAVEISLISSDNVQLATDARPLTGDLVIPVRVDMPEAGAYLFSIEEIQNLPLGACLYVVDLVTGSTIAVEAGAQMELTTNAPFNGVRLEIHATAPVTVITSDATCNGASNGVIDVTTPAGNWTVTLSDVAGNNEYIANGSASFDHLTAGTYTLQVASGNACTAGAQTIVVSEPAEVVLAVNDIRAPQCNLGNEGAIEFEVENSEWFSYELHNALGHKVTSGDMDGNLAVIENLSSGEYMLSVYTECATIETEVVVSDINVVQVEIAAPTEVVMTGDATVVPMVANSSSTNVQWACSNGQVANGEAFAPAFQAPGVYTISATVQQGLCTHTSTHTLVVKSAESVKEQEIAFAQSTEFVSITFGGAVSIEQAWVEILDVQGKLVKQVQVNAPASQRVQVSTEGMNAGVYTVRVRNAQENLFVQKWVRI